MLKRILSVFLCVFLVLSFAACGTTPENPTDDSVEVSGTVGNTSSDVGSTSDSADASNPSSGTNTDSLTGSSSDAATDSVTDNVSSGDSEPTDLTDGPVDIVPGGDVGGGDLGPSYSDGNSDYNPDYSDGSTTDTGIWGDDTSTDTSGDYIDGTLNPGGGTTPDQTPEYSDQNTGSGFIPGIDDGNSSTTDTPLWSGSDDVSTPTDSSGNSNTQDSSDHTSSDGGSGSESVDITTGRKFLATDITNHGIVVYDLDACNGNYLNLTNDRTVYWEWVYKEDINAQLKGPGAGIDAAKLRYSAYYKRDVIIACSSGGWAGVIDYEECTLLWESDAPDLANAHSIEMLPNGDVVVASSQTQTSGKSGLIYVPLSAGIQTPTSAIVCDSAHGVSWDPTNNCLWVLNNKEVFAVTVQNPGRNGKLVKVTGSEVGGFSGGHAFSPVAGSPGKYWIGAGSTVYQFDTKTKTVTKASDILQQVGIKGIASFSDGTVVLAAYKIGGGSPTKEWSSDGFRIVTGDGKSVTVPFATNHREFYKVQPFTRNYQ